MKNGKFYSAMALIAICAAAFMGCPGPDTTGPETNTTVHVASVTLSETSLIMTVGDEPIILTYTIAPSNAANQNVEWSSGAPAVAEVDNGKVTAKTAGSGIITVKTQDGGKTATCTVTVNAATGSTVAVTGISLNKSSTTMLVNGTEKLTATVAPDNATNKAVTWSSSDTAKATVADDGTVTAKTAGTVTITVTTADQNKTATCTVTVSNTAVAVTGVTLTPNTLSLNVNSTQTLTPTITPSGATNQNVTWSSSNTVVATVNEGTVTAKAAGTATITVTTVDGNKTADCAVTVTAGSLSNLSGNINFSQTEGVTTGMVMYARYSGTETVSYQWKKEGVNVGTASTTNPNKFTPTTAGSYTVTVNATGFNSKESNAVTVTALATGYEIMYWGLALASDVPYLKDSDDEAFDDAIIAGQLKQDTINKATDKDCVFDGGGVRVMMVPKSLGDVNIMDALNNNITHTYTKTSVSFEQGEFFMYEDGTNGANLNILQKLRY